jgi:hypothetical protein
MLNDEINIKKSIKRKKIKDDFFLKKKKTLTGIIMKPELIK